jgi:hypothetical protein
LFARCPPLVPHIPPLLLPPHIHCVQHLTLTMTPQFSATAELRTPAHIEIIIDPPNNLRQELKTKKNPGTLHGNEFGATLTPCGDTPDDPAKLPSLAVPESDSDRNGSLTPFISFRQFPASLHSFRGGGKITDGVAAPSAAGSLKREGVAIAPHMFPDPHAGRRLSSDPNFSQLFQRAEKNLTFWYSPSSVSLHSHTPFPSAPPPSSSAEETSWGRIQNFFLL